MTKTQKAKPLAITLTDEEYDLFTFVQNHHRALRRLEIEAERLAAIGYMRNAGYRHGRPIWVSLSSGRGEEILADTEIDLDEAWKSLVNRVKKVFGGELPLGFYVTRASITQYALRIHHKYRGRLPYSGGKYGDDGILAPRGEKMYPKWGVYGR